MTAGPLHLPDCDPVAGCVYACAIGGEGVVARARQRRERKTKHRWSARAQRLNRRAKRVKAEGRVTGLKLQALAKSYKSLCAYCGIGLDFEHPCVKPFDPARATFDHLGVPAPRRFALGE